MGSESGSEATQESEEWGIWLCVGCPGIVILPCHLLAYCFINAWPADDDDGISPRLLRRGDLLFPFPHCPVDECLLDTISGCGILASCRVVRLLVVAFGLPRFRSRSFGWLAGGRRGSNGRRKCAPRATLVDEVGYWISLPRVRWVLCRNAYLWHVPDSLQPP